ncbi:hypothetical protein H2198_003957 [Neophaeococcomyces mojaviensis]|uniref:Uncharacterized protein n=1 Tax=Neophaeococcomyces mojaviensis TaxID=3383035 RepID=A0ACC3AA74_9EURO|nr:hypothetical protein H2198_003957 [Knufia sp. JES_112]
MANNVGDKLLWTAVAVTSIAAYWYIPYFLTYAKELAAVAPPPPENTKPQLQKAAEDAIETSTLAELAAGPSYNLAASAIRLTAARFVKSDAKQKLLEDLKSKSWSRRDRAITGLQLLIFNPDLKESGIKQHFTNDATFKALVDALVNIRDENKHKYNPPTTGIPPSPVRPAYRPAHERIALKIILALMDAPRADSSYVGDPARPAIRAGIIQRWLADYPFPCALPENAKYNYKKSDVCRLLEQDFWEDDDLYMSRLMYKLRQLPAGVLLLADVGLSPPSLNNPLHGNAQLQTTNHPRNSQNTYGLTDLDDDDDDDDEDVVVGELIDDEELIIRLRGDSAPRHSMEQTPEERSLRRRHRNAVVVAEPGSPLRLENILQRHPTETDQERALDTREQDEDPQGDISVACLMDGRSLDEIDGLPSEELRSSSTLPEIGFGDPEARQALLDELFNAIEVQDEPD